ncbi:MAG: hypothetical protein U5N58_12895 [Actinomycetota bacterium]|nr:hypothetical protein [Actinomycetota bacterium]
MEVNIEQIPHKLVFQVQMERGDIVDVIIPKGEILILNKNVNVDSGEVFAKIVMTAKRRLMSTNMKKLLRVLILPAVCPWVVELFEARRPKEHSAITDISGKVEIEDIDSRHQDDNH